MKKCSHCGMENADNERYCVHCGYAMEENQAAAATGGGAENDLFDSPFVVDTTRNDGQNQQMYGSAPAPAAGSIFEEEPAPDNLFEQPQYEEPIYEQPAYSQQPVYEQPQYAQPQQPQNLFEDAQDGGYTASQEYPQDAEGGDFRRAAYEDEAYPPQDILPQQEQYEENWDNAQGEAYAGGEGYEEQGYAPQQEAHLYPAGEMGEPPLQEPYQSPLIQQQPVYEEEHEIEPVWEENVVQQNQQELYAENGRAQHQYHNPAPRNTPQSHAEAEPRAPRQQYELREQPQYEEAPQQQYRQQMPSQQQPRQQYREQPQAERPRQVYREQPRQQQYREEPQYNQGFAQDEYYDEQDYNSQPQPERRQQQPARTQPARQNARAQGQRRDAGYDEEPRSTYRGERPAREPYYSQNDNYEEPRKKGGAVKIIALILAIVLLAGGGFLGTLYYLNSSGRTISNFISILEKKDAASLPGGADADGAGKWDPLFNAFTDQTSKDALRSQLKQGTPAATAPYAAIQMKSEPVFLFIKRYYIDIHAVQVLVPQASQGSILVLDGKQYSGNLSEDGTGLIFSGILPGRYTAQLMTPGQDASTLPEGKTVDLFSTEAPNSIDLTTGNGQTGGGEQGGGEEGGGDSSSSGSSAQDIASAVSVDQANSLLVSFYQSYLNSINSSDISLLKTATSTARTEVERRMGLSGNKDNNFEYVSAVVDGQSLTASESNGVAVITFNATFSYKYWPRDNSKPAEAGSNYQTVQMIYENGEWKVNRFSIINKADFDAHKLATFA